MFCNPSASIVSHQIGQTIVQIATALKTKEQGVQEFLNKYGRFLSAQQRRQPSSDEQDKSSAAAGAKAAASVLV